MSQPALLLWFFASAWSALFLAVVAGFVSVTAWAMFSTPTKARGERTWSGWVFLATMLGALALVMGLCAYTSAAEWLS